jgi:hypothetical protein
MVRAPARHRRPVEALSPIAAVATGMSIFAVVLHFSVGG